MYRIRPDECALIVTVGLLFISISAEALEIKPNASIGMQYSDNASKVATNEKDDLIVIANVGANIDAGSGPFQLDANASLKQVNYTQDTFSNQQYFNLNATAEWEMLKERINWKLQDLYTQQSLDSLKPDVPDNIRDTNVFTFGPIINYRVSDRQSVTVKPEYRLFTYQDQNTDNTQKSLDTSWNYQLFRTASVGIRGAMRKTDYDEQLLTDNTFRNLYLTLSAIRPSYNYSVDIGSTSVEREGSGGARGLTGNMRWSYDITGSSHLRTYIASEITDTNSSLLNAAINPDAGDISNEQTSSEILRNRIFRITYQRKNSNLNTDVWMELRNQDYEFVLLDREVKAVGFNLNYPITAILSTGINTSYSHVELTDVGQEDSKFNIGVNMKYRWSRRLLGAVDIKYNENASDVSANVYKEKSIYLSLVYGYRG